MLRRRERDLEDTVLHLSIKRLSFFTAVNHLVKRVHVRL